MSRETFHSDSNTSNSRGDASETGSKRERGRRGKGREGKQLVGQQTLEVRAEELGAEEPGEWGIVGRQRPKSRLSDFRVGGGGFCCGGSFLSQASLFSMFYRRLAVFSLPLSESGFTPFCRSRSPSFQVLSSSSATLSSQLPRILTDFSTRACFSPATSQLSRNGSCLPDALPVSGGSAVVFGPDLLRSVVDERTEERGSSTLAAQRRSRSLIMAACSTCERRCPLPGLT